MVISPVTTDLTTQRADVSSIKLLGTKLSLCNDQQLLEYISNTIRCSQKAVILSGNIYSFNLAYEQKWLQEFFNRANIVRLDGAGVRLGSRLLGATPPNRMTWADFGWQLAEHAIAHHHTLFFLGARPGIANKAAAQLKESYPSLQITGIHHGYFDKTPNCDESRAIIDMINQANPDILVIGFGMPTQERWLEHHRDQLHVPVVLTGGAVFDYLSGELRRAPTWMTNHGMEWLGRLLIEPKRLWRRYLIGNPTFFGRLAKQHLTLLLQSHGKQQHSPQSRKADMLSETPN